MTCNSLLATIIVIFYCWSFQPSFPEMFIFTCHSTPLMTLVSKSKSLASFWVSFPLVIPKYLIAVRYLLITPSVTSCCIWCTMVVDVLHIFNLDFLMQGILKFTVLLGVLEYCLGQYFLDIQFWLSLLIGTFLIYFFFMLQIHLHFFYFGFCGLVLSSVHFFLWYSNVRCNFLSPLRPVSWIL